ncbi:MAG: peptidoglycan DD-metalloendopeptidase family protein [Thermoanaerobaculia bacterium]
MKLFSYFGAAQEAETAWSFDLPRPDFVAGSYQGRKFLTPSNHLGDDSAHNHQDSVHAIADGVVQEAIPANGFGRVVIVEHKLPDGSYVSSIYGHLCSHRGYPTVREGARVKKGDIVGYVGDRNENGDGLEHIHLGLRKGRYDGYFCGYARAPYCTPDFYYAPTEFIRARSGGMKMSGKIQSFPMSPGGRELTFKAAVANGYFYGGAFEFRLRVLAGDKVRFTSEVQTRKLDRGASASLLFPSTLTDAKTPRAIVELRPPGTETWRPVEA